MICLFMYVYYVVWCVCVYPGMYIYTHTYTDQRRKVSIISPYTTLQLFVLGGRFSLLLIQKLSILAKQACPLAPRVYLSLFSILELQECTAICGWFKLRSSCLENKYSYPPSCLQGPSKDILYWWMINIKPAFYIEAIFANKVPNINIHLLYKWFHLITRLAYDTWKYEVNLLKQPRPSCKIFKQKSRLPRQHWK